MERKLAGPEGGVSAGREVCDEQTDRLAVPRRRRWTARRRGYWRAWSSRSRRARRTTTHRGPGVLISLVEVDEGLRAGREELKEAGFSDDRSPRRSPPVLSTIPNADVVDNLSTFCTNFSQMKAWGSPRHHLRLVKHRNNLEASITGCVDL